MHVIDAAHQTVHDYPGGSEALGPRMGMSGAVLRNKVNPHNTTHHLTLAEAVRMMALTGDLRILRAIADELGQAVHPLPEVQDSPSGDVLENVLGLAEAQGNFSGSMRAALADEMVTPRELRLLREKADKMQAELALLIRKLQAMVRASPLQAVS